MLPEPRLATIATIQHAITSLLTTYEPAFLSFGLTFFRSIAVILIVWHGLKMMFTQQTVATSEHLFEFAKLLLFISFGYALIAYTESPIPGVGVSLSNLITDQAANFADILDARSLELTFEHLDDLWDRFVQPDTWAILPNLLYWLVLIIIAMAKAAALGAISYGMIATAVCGLLGPIFVPFLIVPYFEFMFWGWLKAFIQFAFIQVVAFAYLMIFERFVFQFVTTMPAGITEDQYLLYGVQSIVVIATFALGTLLIPSLTGAIFSGGGAGLGVLPSRL